MTWFDLLLIGVLVVSIGFAVIRGAIREFATLLALGLAAGVAYLLFSPLLGLLGLKGSFFGMVALAGALFAIAFVIIYTGFHIALKQVRLDPTMRRVDLIGGGVFGLARGLALIGLGFLGYAYYLDADKRPDAVNGAALLPVAQAAAGFFESLAPSHDSKRIITPEEIEQKKNAANDGYARGDRAALEEIVVTTTSDPDGAAATPASLNAPPDANAEPVDPIAEILDEDDNGER
ncbi:MAG: CvpA family protein [Pseudomonadota bacterium]